MKRIACVVVLAAAAALVWVAAPAVSQPKVVRIGDLGSKVGVFEGYGKYQKMGIRVYIFYTDYAMGQSDGRQFKTALEKLGGDVVGVAGAPLDTKDFSPWFGAINQATPEVLFLAFAGTDSLRLMTQLYSFGMTKKYKLAGIACFPVQKGLTLNSRPMVGLGPLNPFFTGKPGQ